MLESLGQALLRGTAAVDDGSLAYHRADGDPRSRTICFLPWRMPYRLAVVLGLVPRDYLACYEMPSAIVSSEPKLCIEAMMRVTQDAEALVRRSGHPPASMVIIGLSIGSAAATYVANVLGARLLSISSADRGDLTLWESPATRHVRQFAEEKGYRLEHFSEALEGYHTIENLSNIAPASAFVFGKRDELIPEARRDGLASAVRLIRPEASITLRDASHIGTMVETLRDSVAAA